MRSIAFPLGLMLAVASAVLTVSIYAGDWLYNWSAVTYAEPQQALSFRYHAPVQPFYLAMVVFLAGSTLGAAANVWIGWHLPMDGERRRPFGWLFLSAVLFVVGTNVLSLSNLLSWDLLLLILLWHSLTARLAHTGRCRQDYWRGGLQCER